MWEANKQGKCKFSKWVCGQIILEAVKILGVGMTMTATDSELGNIPHPSKNSGE